MRRLNETIATVFTMAYVAMVANLLLVAGSAPLVLGLLSTDPARSWPLLALVTPLCLPAVVGVFAVFAEASQSAGRGRGPGGVTVFGTFGRAWLASWWRSVSLGALAIGALVVLAVDIAWAWGQRIGAVAIPVLAMLMLLVLVTVLHAVVVLAQLPTVRLRDALRASVYLAVRRWYLTALSLLVLALLVQAFAAKPALAMGLLAAPLLYVVWANTRFALRPALDFAPAQASADGGPVMARAATAT